MKLLFKQRFFSWFDSYDIYNETGNTVYTIQGKLSWGHRLEIYNVQDNCVGMVQERVLTFLPRSRWSYGHGGEKGAFELDRYLQPDNRKR